MKIQSRRLEESIHIPTFSTKTQDQFLQERESGIQYSSEELSENETITKVNYFIWKTKIKDQNLSLLNTKYFHRNSYKKQN